MNPENWGTLRPHVCGDWAWLHMCYHVKFGSFASNGVCIKFGRKEPQNLGVLGPPPLCGGG